MTFLPIVTRELRLAARRRGTYWVRVSYAMIASFLGGYLLLLFNVIGIGRRVGPSTLSIIGFPMLYITLFAGIAAADSISQEKREGTLGLLFLTDLKGYDVIFGKLCASATASFYGLLAMMPIAAFSLILGGVTGGEVVRACLTLLNAVFFSHAAAIIISTVSHKMNRAISGTTLLVVVFTMILPFLASVLEHFNHADIAILLTMISPLTPAQHVSNSGIRPGQFWYPLLGSHLCAWAFLAYACWRVPRSWQDQASPTRLRWREGLRQWSYGSPAIRTAFRLRLLAVNPYHWLLNRARFKPAMIWGFLASLAAGSVYLCFKVTDLEEAMAVFMSTQIALHAGIKVWIASEASWCLEEQRRNGGLELLLCCTPLKVSDILQGCWQTLRRLFLWPIILILIVDIVFFALSAATKPEVDMFGFLACIFASMIMLVADAVALGWVGLWAGLTAKKARKASANAVRQILIMPWVLVGLITSLAPRLFMKSSSIVEMTFWKCFWIWFILGIGTDLFYSLRARRNLLTQFRELAATGFEEQIGFFGKLGRMLGKATARRS